MRDFREGDVLVALTDRPVCIPINKGEMCVVTYLHSDGTVAVQVNGYSSLFVFDRNTQGHNFMLISEEEWMYEK